MKNYYITIDFYSEPNYNGNMSRYYFSGFNGKNKISYSGTTYKKIYCSKCYAEKAAARIKESFPAAKVGIVEIDLCA